MQGPPPPAAELPPVALPPVPVFAPVPVLPPEALGDWQNFITQVLPAGQSPFVTQGPPMPEQSQLEYENAAATSVVTMSFLT
jgi:hypothetical protein